jgi:hypothetical protein
MPVFRLDSRLAVRRGLGILLRETECRVSWIDCREGETGI